MKLAVAIFAACLCLVPLSSPAVPIIVDVGGGGDYLTIQEAIDACPDGGEIEVWPGTYTDEGNRDITFGTKNLTLSGRDGWAATIIDPGRGVHRVFDFPKSGQDTTCVIDGFTIQGGHLQDTFVGGAGIRIDGTVGSGPGPASPKFVNCLIRNNVNQLGPGGGVYLNWGCSPVFRNVTFESNSSYTGGGGVYATWNCLPKFSNCTFFNNENSIYGSGGGIYCKFGSDATLVHCLFDGNAAVTGGGMACYGYASPSLTNVTFIGNGAGSKGGAAYCDSLCSPQFVNVTCYANWSQGDGEVLYVKAMSHPVIRRSLFALNGAQARGASFYCDGTSGVDVLQSCSFGNESGNDMCTVTCDRELICEDPLFCDPASGDLTLAETSPCLPSGNVWAAQIGAHGEGCSQPAVEETSWGAIKALYRLRGTADTEPDGRPTRENTDASPLPFARGSGGPAIRAKLGTSRNRTSPKRP